MSLPSELLAQCLDVTKQLITLNQKAVINIRIGSEFIFSFNNQEISEKKKSPSQMKRNLERNETFKNMKKETSEIIAKTLEKKTETKDSESQTNSLSTATTGTNTDMNKENNVFKDGIGV